MSRSMLLIPIVMVCTLWSGVVFANGNRFIFSELTVKDTRTDLVWTRRGDFGKCAWPNAFKLVRELNQKEYAGYNNWRLPSKSELLTLATYAKKQSLINKLPSNSPYELFNQMGFVNIIDNTYWSSTTHNEDTFSAWFVNLFDGSWGFTLKSDIDLYVWPVRGGKLISTKLTSDQRRD